MAVLVEFGEMLMDRLPLRISSDSKCDANVAVLPVVGRRQAYATWLPLQL